MDECALPLNKGLRSRSARSMTVLLKAALVTADKSMSLPRSRSSATTSPTAATFSHWLTQGGNGSLDLPVHFLNTLRTGGNPNGEPMVTNSRTSMSLFFSWRKTS